MDKWYCNIMVIKVYILILNIVEKLIPLFHNA